MHESEWAPLISRYIDGDLDESEQKALLEHVEHCVVCRETERSMRRVVTIAVEARNGPLPSGDWIAMRAKMDRSRFTGSGIRSRIAVAALAASVAVAVTLGTMELHMSQKAAIPAANSDSISAAARLRELEKDILEIEALLKADPGNELARQLHSRALEIRASRLLSVKLTPSHLE